MDEVRERRPARKADYLTAIFVFVAILLQRIRCQSSSPKGSNIFFSLMMVVLPKHVAMYI
jgi:hypothetical protein